MYLRRVVKHSTFILFKGNVSVIESKKPDAFKEKVPSIEGEMAHIKEQYPQ